MRALRWNYYNPQRLKSGPNAVNKKTEVQVLISSKMFVIYVIMYIIQMEQRDTIL